MIELIVLDVDGCLTDGRISHTQNGDEIKSFNVKDGLAIATWIRMGKRAAIITGRTSKIVEKRAKELKITHIHQGIKDKKAKLDQILETEGLTYAQVAVIGDDLNDYRMLDAAGIAFTPSDGASQIEPVIDVRLSRPGGGGAVREMIEHIVQQEGLQERFLAPWL